MDSYKSIYGCLLLELTITEVQSRKTSKKFVRAAEADMEEPNYVMHKLTEIIPRDIQEQSKGNALNWLTSLYIKGAIVVNSAKETRSWPGEWIGERPAGDDPEGDVVAINININVISNALETFYQAKEQNLTHFLTIKSIEQIPDISTLLTVATQARSQIQKHNDDKIENDRTNAYDTLVYEDDQWSMYLPKTKGDTCALGRGTDWCTAGIGLDYYSDYVHPWYAERFDLGPQKLFIIISKTDKNEKYQLWFGWDVEDGDYYDGDWGAAMRSERGDWGAAGGVLGRGSPEDTLKLVLKRMEGETSEASLLPHPIYGHVGMFMDKKDNPMSKPLQYKFMSIIEDKLYDQLGVVEKAVFEAVQETYSIVDNKVYMIDEDALDDVHHEEGIWERDGVIVVHSIDTTPGRKNSGIGLRVRRDSPRAGRSLDYTNHTEQPDHLEFRRCNYRTQDRVKELTSDTPIDLYSVMFYTDKDVDGEYIFNIQQAHGPLLSRDLERRTPRPPASGGGGEQEHNYRGYQIHKEKNGHGEGSGVAILDWDSDDDTISYRLDGLGTAAYHSHADRDSHVNRWSEHMPTDEAIAKGVLDKHPLEYLKDTPLHTTIGKLPDNLSFDTEAVSKLYKITTF